METQKSGKFFIGSIITVITVYVLVTVILAFMQGVADNVLPPESMADEDVVERIKPVAQVNVGEAPIVEVAAATSDPAESETVTRGENGEYIIKMLNGGKEGAMVFEPSFLHVEKGATVRFVPTDASHNSMSIFTPEAAEGWVGENSKEVVVTLDDEGVYIYKCLPHIMMGMVGVIQVGEATNKAEAEKEAEKLASKMMMGKDRLSNYLAQVSDKAAPVSEADTKADSKSADKEKVEPEAVANATNGKEHIVKMLNTGKDGMMVFEPAFLKIDKGDTVKFMPTDAGHDSVSAFTPEGATGWVGENSKEVVVTLDAEGVYIYKCIPHLMMGMVGVIQVGEATNKAEAEKEAEKMAATMAMGKDRLGNYLAEVK